MESGAMDMGVSLRREAAEFATAACPQRGVSRGALAASSSEGA